MLEQLLNQLFISGSGLESETPPMSFLDTASPWRPMGAALLAATCLLPAQADDRRDHDRARAALQAGEVMPLQDLLNKLQRSHPGDVLEVELERDEGRWIYELKILQSGGRLLRLDVDARTAEVLRARTRHHKDEKASRQPVPGTQP